MMTFISSNETVATVDQQGNVTAHQLGTVTITAKANSDVSASCQFIVRPIQFILTLPVYLTTIESEAFADLSSVDAVRIPTSVTEIANNAFSGSNVIILAPENSYAAQWAEAHGMPFLAE